MDERVEDVYAKTAGWVVKAAHEEENNAESAAEGSGEVLFDFATPEHSDAESDDGKGKDSAAEAKKKVTWRHICTSRDIPDQNFDIEDEVLLSSGESSISRRVVPITIVGDSDRIIVDDSHKTAEERDAEAYLAGSLGVAQAQREPVASAVDGVQKPMKLETGLAMQVYQSGSPLFENREDGVVGMLPLRDAANQIFGVMQIVSNNEKTEASGSRHLSSSSAVKTRIPSLLFSDPVKRLAEATAQVIGSDVLNTQLFEETESELRKASLLHLCQHTF